MCRRKPPRIRVSERGFLNLPGFEAGAYVRVLVEDTTGLEPPLPRDIANWLAG